MRTQVIEEHPGEAIQPCGQGTGHGWEARSAIGGWRGSAKGVVVRHRDKDERRRNASSMQANWSKAPPAPLSQSFLQFSHAETADLGV